MCVSRSVSGVLRKKVEDVVELPLAYLWFAVFHNDLAKIFADFIQCHSMLKDVHMTVIFMLNIFLYLVSEPVT